MRRALCAALLAVLVAGCGGPDNAAFDGDYDSGTAAEVTVSGTVVQLLPDSHGSDGTHQVFAIVVDGRRVEIDHNVSLAPRVPLSAGEAVTLQGQFEPDPGHPVIHYTHHATGSHPGGWIQAGGQTYS